MKLDVYFFGNMLLVKLETYELFRGDWFFTSFAEPEIK